MMARAFLTSFPECSRAAPAQPRGGAFTRSGTGPGDLLSGGAVAGLCRVARGGGGMTRAGRARWRDGQKVLEGPAGVVLAGDVGAGDLVLRLVVVLMVGAGWRERPVRGHRLPPPGNDVGA